MTRNMIDKNIIDWLLDGDVSIQYQVYRDLLGSDRPKLRNRIETEGWGLKFLSYRKQDGHWGLRFYQPKWISTHYTLLDLKNLNISPENKKIKESIIKIFQTEKEPDSGIYPVGKYKKCDVCLNGMVLNYASYFKIDERSLVSIIDFLLAEKMNDGGFNCLSNTAGAMHSSLHTTLSVLEGIAEYQKNGYTYRLAELLDAKKTSEEFILMHRLFLSDRTGKVIKPDFLKLFYPGRWFYDILKALDYFQHAKVDYDHRMKEAIEVILRKRTKEGLWKLPSKHPGQTHFDMEKAGEPSRWNTLRALRVLKHFDMIDKK